MGAVIDDKFNEELDTMTINLAHSKYDGFLSYLLPNNTKVLYIPHVKIGDVIVTLENGEKYVDVNKLFTFDYDGKPINHKQYIVCGGSINYGKTVIKHQYGLVEPTALLRLGYTGTNSHTNMPKAVVYDTNGNTTTYEQTETNLYSIIERQFKITGLKTSIENRTWYRHFNIKAKYLKNSGVGISESFNNATLYDSMFKLGKYIKCYPVVYFNKDYDPNNSNEKEFNLFFESYELRNQKKVVLNDIKCLDASWSVVNSTGRFTNHVVCESENIIPTQEMTYPNEEEYVGLTGDLGEIAFNEPGQNQPLPYYLRVGKKIHSVKEVTMIIINMNYGTDSPVGVVDLKLRDPLRITYAATTYEEWLLLSDVIREKTAYYSISDDKIYVGHLYDIKNIHNGYDINCYIGKVKYKPLITAKIEFGNGDYTDIYNQTDSNLDGNMFGNYVQEYAKSQTNYDVLFQAVFENYNDIPESGTIISNNENDFIIISRKILVNKTSFYVSFALNYYEPKRSELINASKKITKTFVDSSKAFERMVNFKETYLVDATTNENDIVNQNPKFFKDYKSIVPFLNDDKSKLNSAFIHFEFDYDNSLGTTNKDLRSPINYSTLGTSIVINFDFMSSKIFKVFGGYFQFTGNSSRGNNILCDYTDVFGKVERINLLLSSAKGRVDNYGDYYNESIDQLFDNLVAEYPSKTNEGKRELLARYADIFLYATVNKSSVVVDSNELQEARENAIFELNDLEVLKDTNEILNFTYQIEFLPKNKNKLMILNNFVKFSNFINHEETDFINHLYIAKINNGLTLDATTEKIDSLDFVKIGLRVNANYNNALWLYLKNFKMEEDKQYVLCGKYNEEYYPLILLFNTESKEFINDDGSKYSTLILYLTNANI